MKSSTILGVVLIILGLAGMIFQGVTYTTQEKVVDIGDLHVTAAKEKTIPIPLIAGALALVGGIAIVVVAGKKG